MSTDCIITNRATKDRTNDDCTNDDRTVEDRTNADRPHSRQFESFSMDCLNAGLRVRFQARGSSMSSSIRDGEMVYVRPASEADLRRGDIVLVKSGYGFRLHRLIRADAGRDIFITRGDCALQDDPPVSRKQILGVAVAKDVRVGTKTLRAQFWGARGCFLRVAARTQSILSKVPSRVGLRRPRPAGSRPKRQGVRNILGAWGLLTVLLASPYLRAQVAVDASTSGSATMAGAGTTTLTFAHTTTATANRVLIVGVSINITNSPTTGVVGVTYNGAALNFVGAHNDAGGTRRVEMWYQLAPASGNHNVVVSVNIPTAVNEGVVAGATSFTGVDQTVPLGTFVSADGAAGANSQLDVPSVINGMILDTLATDGTRTITVSGPQVSQWNVQRGNNTNPGVRGVGSSRAGAPSVPISETFSGNSNWSLGAITINPTTADIAVTTTVGSAVFLGQNTTYNITVTNNGPSPANNVVLTDVVGLTPVSVTPSAGTTCVGTTTLTCTLPTPLASGATATVAVVINAATSGAYPNTASVADSGTPPDPNTGNNTFVAVATVQAVACAGGSQAAPGNNLTGTLNTYYPGTANAAAGATSITVGAATGGPGGVPTPIAAGNLLLVIQMQDASINDSNNVAYGNGGTGQGFTALNSAGDYEFVTAQSAVGTGGGTVTISGAGASGGLVFAYHHAAASTTAGQSTYQVIVVPQYTTASFSAASPPTASAWNGSTGGVLALDTSSTLTLNGATVSMDGKGFRGGAGLQLNGGVAGSNTDYLHAAPAAYTGVAENGLDAVKGEGIAGTPFWVESGGTFVPGNSSYPSGAAGVDGSSARGAPGNAGGGGTDADAAGNSQNAGGGGGANGGAGGFGGDSWNTNLSDGGEGGVLFPATISRIAMGGGGGAGSRNNSDGDNQASGGAAAAASSLCAPTRSAAPRPLRPTELPLTTPRSTMPAAAAALAAPSSCSPRMVEKPASRCRQMVERAATLGNSAYSLADRHGPGGGGGGGVVLVSGTPASISVAGGTNGLTLNPGVAYGATPGTVGTSVTNASISSTSGTQSGAQCTPDVTLSKNSAGIFTRGLTASYTIPVSNISPYGPSSSTVTVNDTLPVGLIPTSASGSGWACSVVSQTVSCTDSNVLAAGGTYPSITINATVAQTAPSTVTNIAVVSGGGEVNLSNDTATNVASVISSADLSVTNAAVPDPVAAGSNITYTQVVTDNGPSAADNATLVEPVPANTTFVSMSAPAGWTCLTPSIGATGNVVCTTLSMTGNTSASFSMIVKVNAATANGTVIADTATVSSSVSDPNSTNNSATASTVVGTTAQAELTVTNAASPNPAVVGNSLTFTQVVTNTGSVAATGPATFNEVTPANTTLVSITPPAGWTCSSFPPQCTNPSVAAGSGGTFTVVYTVTGGTSITDTATVNAGNQAFGANSATIIVPVATSVQADLALSTVATPAIVNPGNNITYTQTVTNNGPATASGVSFTEAIPANTTFVSVSAPAGWTCVTTTSVTCTDPSFATSTSADIIVVVNVAPSVAVATITATSSVSATTSDPNSSNNTTTVITAVSAACDLAVTNSGSPSPVAAGGNITYTQVITNSGPGNCSTATFNEALPANTTFVSVAVVTTGGGTWTCPNASPVACTNPSVPPGSTGTITAIYNVPAGTTAGTLINDTATVATTTRDTNPLNNSATVTIGVAGATQADLSVTNSASPNPVTAGQTITYTQTVTNNGPAMAGGTSVTLSDQVPANTTYVSQSGPAGWSCGVFSSPFYTCSIASLAANSSATFTFVVSVNPTTASGTTITDTDSVSAAPTTDPNPNNNNATASVVVADSANLSVTNSANPVPVQAGSNITYTQVVTNAGPSNATGASFTETTPPNTTFVQLTPIPSGWMCILPTAGSAGTITCTNPSFAPGTSSFPVVLKVTAGTAAGTVINDTATATSSTPDPNLANNSATAADVVALSTQADLVTTNSAVPTSVASGSNVTYTQTVNNLGPAQATSATFTQTTPPNTNFQSITPPAGWACSTMPPVGGTGLISCSDGSNLALNTPVTFTLVLQVNAGTPSGTNIAETATATASNIVPSLTTNSATATVIVANANSADMAIVKTATPSPERGGRRYAHLHTRSHEQRPGIGDQCHRHRRVALRPSHICHSPPRQALARRLAAPSPVCSELWPTGVRPRSPSSRSQACPASSRIPRTVSADQVDPTPTTTLPLRPKLLPRLRRSSCKVSQRVRSLIRLVQPNRVPSCCLLENRSEKSHNLGFNIYRELDGQRVRVNPSLIAGSALLMSGALPKHSGKTYSWIDFFFHRWQRSLLA